MKIFKNLTFISLALFLFSCSDEQESLSNHASNAVTVEIVPSQPSPRTMAKTQDWDSMFIYNVRYKDILMDSVKLSPSYASKLMTASAIGEVQYLTLRGYTDIEKNPNGRKGGDNFACIFNSEGAKKFGMPAGTYICRDVYFINKYPLPTEDFVVKPNGSVTSENMGYIPGQKPTYGFELLKSGSTIVCKTEGTLILSDASGIELNRTYPVLAENMEFNVKYVIVDF